VKVDGFEFEVGDNKVTDVIPGVTLDLKQANPGKTVNITVKEDREVVAGKVKTFVDGMNEVLKFIQQQNTLGKDTDTSSTLGGDSLLRSIENRMRSLIQNPQYGVNGSINRLNQIGISFNRSGVLEYDEKKFNDTLAKDPGAVQRFLAGDGFSVGFIPAVRREVSTVLNSAFGPVAIRKRALQDKIGQMNDSIANKERQLSRKEEQLRNKFAKLEETMSKLKGQMGQVAAAGLGGGGGGGGGIPGMG
jgi:flagellar hook-associated protein 2